MARQLRIEYPGAIYHVTSRGNERSLIYLDDGDRKHFIQVIKECSGFYHVDVMAYCLMTNHFHLLLSTREANLSRFMQSLNTSYTRYFNHKHKRSGHLMQGRYKAIVVGSEDYLLRLSRYIHLNPVKIKTYATKTGSEKARILDGYKWSSLIEVLEPGKRSPYLRCGKVLESTGGDTVAGRHKYKQYVMEGLGGVLRNPMDDVKYQLILGTETFVEWIKEQFVKGKDKNIHPHLKEIDKAKDVEVIAAQVAKKFNIRAEEIVRRSSHHVARQVLIELVHMANLKIMSLKDMGEKLGGISGSAVAQTHKRIREKLTRDKKLNDLLNALAVQLSIVEA